LIDGAMPVRLMTGTYASDWGRDRCKLKLLRMERINDHLKMEEEYVENEERLKPTLT
jgi:deoxyhypusine synthase